MPSTAIPGLRPAIDAPRVAAFAKSTRFHAELRGICAALRADMPNTKTSAFSSIDSTVLAGVNGGCGSHRCHHGGRSKVVNIVNNYGAPAAAPAPAPSGGNGVAVNVSAGYAQG